MLLPIIKHASVSKNTDLKVLLVHPPLYRLYPSQKEDSKRHQMEPLSLEMIAAHNPHQIPVSIYDMDVYPDWDEFSAFLEREQPNVIGITVNTPLVLEAKQITKVVKKILDNPFVIVGGNHCTHGPDHSLRYTGADLVWRADAEDLLSKLVEWDIPAAVRSGEMKNIYTGTSIEDEEGKFVMDRLNFPYRHNPEDYHYTTMQTSRGCIWECIYCGSADKGVRWRTSGNILQELDILHDRNLLGKQIYFLDDCFLDNPPRVRELCAGIKERDYKIQFWIETRADTIKESLMKTLSDAGCYQITFGLESGNQEILDSLSKKIGLGRVRRAIKIVHDHGIRIRANFMIGHYKETEAQVWDTIHFAEGLANDGLVTTIAFYKVLPLPGTPLYRMIKEAGIEIEKSFEDFAWYGKTVSRMSQIEPERLDELHTIAYDKVAQVSNKDRKTVDY